ncbi:NADH-ubiquinone oxidoreductase-F iron-sulfur binding region domain-containing protein [Herbinix luporum]|uniref:NADH-ubiquinone oxidoreductase-F iron-sulfur binding region domain-containing protein n=1 Tax=Herbinix luporum TaxID=1679721 RepID=UPI0023F28A40|nr:NADH-ubiquinone oxidoreductase-F iron-sulfur binding region domain-containing protein [Herbinix luporum]
MRAFDNAKKYSPEEVLAQIASSGLKEYGLYQEPVVDRWNKLSSGDEEAKSRTLVAALNNSDTIGIFLELLKQDQEQIIEGMKIAAYALNADRMILQLPEFAKELAAELSELARENEIEVLADFIDIREYRDKDYYINHIVTMKNLYDIFTDQYVDGTYISINGSKLKKYPNSTKLSELIDDKNLKGLIIGHCIHSVSVLNQTVGEFNIPNGLIKTLTEDNCIIHEVNQWMAAYHKQSCGKCVFCREGLIQLHGMIKDTTEGKGKEEYISIINEIGSAMIYSTLCSLGQESAKIALSSLEHFSQEFEEHIKKKKCNAKICSSFQMIYIDPIICQGCEDCQDVCPVDCIDGKKGFIHMIDEFECTKCGECIKACEYGAIIQTTGRVPKLPDRLIKCGKFRKR